MFLTGEAARVLGLPVDGVSRREPLNGQGLDSLMAADVRRAVQRRLGVLVPLTKLLRGTSIDELAADIAGSLAAQPQAEAGVKV